MKVVITGANSFLGRYLVEEMSRYGAEILAVMRPGRQMKLPESASVLPLSMDEYAELGHLTGGCDCLVHLAWMGTHGTDRQRLRMDRQLQSRNCQLSIQAVESMLKAGCKRVITAGSQAEYGLCREPVTEEHICCPHTEYGKAKLRFYEQTVELCQKSGAEYKEPRIFSLYGVGDGTNTMITQILHNMRENLACELTECLQLWDFLHVSDAAKALALLCSKPCPDGIYNVAGGDIRPLKEYILEMAELSGTKSELRFGAVPYPETGIVSLQPDISKLKRELGWAPQMTFQAGIKAVLREMGNESVS